MWVYAMQCNVSSPPFCAKRYSAIEFYITLKFAFPKINMSNYAQTKKAALKVAASIKALFRDQNYTGLIKSTLIQDYLG